MAPTAQPAPDPSIFHLYLLERYPALKSQHPSLSRRALLLFIADEFWSLDARTWTALTSAAQPNSPTEPLPWAHHTDEYDVKEDDAATTPPGIIVRTDYSTGSDDAWAAFCSALHDAERDFFADQAPAIATTTTSTESNGDDDDDDDGESDDASSTDDDESSLALFAPLSDAAQFNNISNLRALRLLFDVSARTTQQSAAQHRLSGLRGLQETYDARGRTLWIFDARSRSDGCARLVGEAGDVATGDSWRARGTHMAELQAGLAARALRIDFGGLDRWDYDERRRNMVEADAGHAPVLSGLS